MIMTNCFRTIKDIFDDSRKGNSLYSIYQRLERSKALLKEQQKNAFELLFETLLPSLTKEQTQELVKFPIKSLEIYATKISIPVSQILAQFKGEEVSLNCLQEIDEGVAKVFAQFQGNTLYLNALKEIDETIARALAQFKGRWRLSLNGVQQLDEATADALIQWKGFRLYLNGLQEIDEATAKALSQYTGTIYATDKILEQIRRYK